MKATCRQQHGQHQTGHRLSGNAVVDLSISTTQAEKLTLALRIPYWSDKTASAWNGKVGNVRRRVSKDRAEMEDRRYGSDRTGFAPVLAAPDEDPLPASITPGKRNGSCGAVNNRGHSPAGLALDLLLDGATTMADVTRAAGAFRRASPARRVTSTSRRSSTRSDRTRPPGASPKSTPRPTGRSRSCSGVTGGVPVSSTDSEWSTTSAARRAPNVLSRFA